MLRFYSAGRAKRSQSSLAGVFDRILAVRPVGQADVVLSGGAPSSSRIARVDQSRALFRAGVALDRAAKVLKRGTGALIKTHRGAGFQEPARDAGGRFAKVKLLKPAAHRVLSPEMYLLAKDFRLV